MITNKNVITIGISVAFIVAISTIPLANATSYDFPIPRYSVWDGCGVSCGTYIGQHSPDNLTGDNTMSNSVTIEITPQYSNNGGVEVPITAILCSLDNAVPSSCNDPTHQGAIYTNLAIGQHFFKAILVTSFGNDPNPPVFTWKITGTPPHLTLGQTIAQNTWIQLCKYPTVFNSIQGRMHCIR